VLVTALRERNYELAGESAVLATNGQAPTFSSCLGFASPESPKPACGERGSYGYTRKCHMGLIPATCLTVTLSAPLLLIHFHPQPHASDTRVSKTPRPAVRSQNRARHQPQHVMHACGPTRRINLSPSGLSFGAAGRQPPCLVPSGARYCSFGVPTLRPRPKMIARFLRIFLFARSALLS
jgi:hypothetical protein